MEKLARLAGARFVLRELAHERSAKPGSNLKLQMKWANVGVGKLQRDWRLRLFLINEAGQVVTEADARANPREWLPGEHEIHPSLQLPGSILPGNYTVAVSLLDPMKNHRPFRLAFDAPEKEGRYSVSKIVVE